jgi:hypothetical protein
VSTLDLTGLSPELVTHIRQVPPNRQALALAGIRAKEMWPGRTYLVGLIRLGLLNGDDALAHQVAEDVLEIWRSYSELEGETYKRRYANAADRYRVPPKEV